MLSFKRLIISVALFAAVAMAAQDSAITAEQVMDWIDHSADTLSPGKTGEKRQCCDTVHARLRMDGFAEIALALGSPDPQEKEDALLGKAGRLFTMTPDIKTRGTLSFAARQNLLLVLGAGATLGNARDVFLPAEEKSGGGEVRLEQAYADYTPYSFLGLEGGMLRVPFSRFNREFDERNSPCILRGDFYTYLVPTPWYDAGFLIKGEARPARRFSADWQVGVIRGLGDDVSGGRGLEKARLSGNDVNRSNALCGILGLHLPGVAAITLSGYSGAVDIYDRHALGMGLAEFSLKLGYAGLEAGYFGAQIDTLVNSAGDTLPLKMQGVFVEIRGEYPLPRFGLLSGSVSWEDVDLDETEYSADVIGFPSHRKVFSLGLGLRPNSWLCFKAEFRSPQNNSDRLNPGRINDDLFLLGITVGSVKARGSADE